MAINQVIGIQISFSEELAAGDSQWQENLSVPMSTSMKQAITDTKIPRNNIEITLRATKLEEQGKHSQ